MTSEEIPVLIIGGSLVGLTTAMLLGEHGVPSLSVERHAGTAIHPRAGHFQLGTTEMLRQAGLEDTVRTTSAKTYSPSGGIIAVESLAGAARHLRQGAQRGCRGLEPDRSGLHQPGRARADPSPTAVELGATVINRTEVVGLEQDDDGVTATLRDLDGRPGAHGPRALRRRRRRQPQPDARAPRHRMAGYGELSRSITIYFRADCAALLKDRNQGVIYVHNPELRGFFRLDRSGGNGFLVINTVGEDVTTDEAVSVSDGLTEERVRGVLESAIGTPDVPSEILDVVALAGRVELRHAPERGARLPRRRRRARRAAQRRFRRQRRHPGRPQPGVEARRRDQWRSRAGTAGHLRRRARPLSRLVVEQAYTRYATRVVPERGTDDVEPLVADIEMELGLVMHSSAVIADGAEDDGALPPSESRGRPGTRAPHVVLGDDRSTIDLFGRSFVLLLPPARGPTTGRPRAWRRTSSTPRGSPRATACHLAAGRWYVPTGSSAGARPGRSSARSCPARWTRSWRGKRPTPSPV